MAARRSDEDEREENAETTSPWKRIVEGKWQRFATIPVILVLFTAGAWTMWQRYGDQVLGHPSYQLDPQLIQYTAPPEWLQQDILVEVVRDGSLESLQIHRPDLTVHIAGAFEHHPWVKRVDRVRKKYPAAVEVELTYRSPVGMVVVPQGLQPVDADGVAMPGEGYITGEFAQRFPRILVGQTLPVSLGAGWGDPVVVEAAKLAAVLYADWETLGQVLNQIQLSNQATSLSASPSYEILGRPEPGRAPALLIHWGRAPGKELAGEPAAKDKLASIKLWVARFRQNGLPPQGELDVRSTRDLSAMRGFGRGLQ